MLPKTYLLLSVLILFFCGCNHPPTSSFIFTPSTGEAPLYKPYLPSHVLIGRSGELQEYFSTPIEVTPLGFVEIPGMDDSLRAYSVTFTISSFSTHAIIDYEKTSAEELSECDAPETACRCGRIVVERGEHDYSNEECTLSQSVVRVKFLDCPGQPVEEFTEVIPTAGCEEIEPIPDLLNYRPGQKWSFSLLRTQSTPRDDQWDFGNHNAKITIDAEIEILPEMSPDGKQTLSGTASGILEWEILPVTTENHHCDVARSGPLSISVDFQSGIMNWHSPSRPPSLNFALLIKSEGAPRTVNYGIIQCRSLGPEPELFEEEIGLAYVRYYGFVAVPLVPFSGTWEYPSGSRTPDNPWWTLLMLSYPSFSSSENVSLAPF